MKCDIWSFGCVLYEMLVGNVLFEFANKTEHQKSFTHNKSKILYDMVSEVKKSFENLKYNNDHKDDIQNKKVSKKSTAISYHEEDFTFDIEKTCNMMINVLQNTICFQPKSRFSATKLLNTFFYKDFSNKINEYRRLYCDNDLNDYISKCYTFEYELPDNIDSGSIFQKDNEPLIKCNFIYASFIDRPLPNIAKSTFDSIYKKISRRHFFMGYYLFDNFLNTTSFVNNKNIQIYIQYSMYTAGKYFEIFTIPDALLYMPSLKLKDLRDTIDECITNFDDWIIKNPIYYRNIYEDKRKASDIYKTLITNRKYIENF